MKDNQAKYPQLRFKGFTDPWEQRKLGELADIVGGGTPSTNNDEYWNGDIDWYSPVEINNQIYVSGSKNKITELGLQKSSAKVLPIGTVLFTSRAGIGKTAILAKKGTTNQGFQSILPHENKLDSYFIFSRTDELKRYGETNGAGSTFVEVSGKQMSKMPIMLPKIEEQMRIGTFFQQLDNLITLHQRKLAKLKELKQGYLQKLFPQNGSKFPQLRFSGFADAWEERKLTDLATTYIGLVTTMAENYTTEGTLLIRNSDIKEGRFDLSNPIYLEEQFAEKNKTRRMKKGDVVTVHTGDIGTSAIINSELDGTIGFATITTRPKKELDSNFLAWYFNSNYHKKYAKRMSTGDGRSNYNMKDFNKNVIPTPKIAEQQKIGSFFKQLDETLALHQRKLEKLQELKKGYLQKMFC
ncbi:restriction endonuclease subunit S [Pediococcus acidilactici]|uniref:restriction endonuclease subunit S n=1 Tax=Pediococcus acidilactici TaxID=1254 RepID=UPI002F26BBA3